MNHREWVLSQFEVDIIKEGKFKDWICLRTPLAAYRIKRDDWECIKKKLMKI